jgi:molecular chaperone HscA
VESGIEVKPSYGLSDTEIETMLHDSIEFAEADVAARKLLEQQVEADRVLEALAVALVQDRKLLNDEERNHIDVMAARLQAARDEGTNHLAIKKALEELDKSAATFVARRMDTSIKNALAGHSVDEFSETEK